VKEKEVKEGEGLKIMKNRKEKDAEKEQTGKKSVGYLEG
jgi:hypothetical protein